MGGTVKGLVGREASNIGVPSVNIFEVAMDSGEDFSEPILLQGAKVISLELPTLSATDVTIEATNFSTNEDVNDQVSGFRKPLAADFKPLIDMSATAVEITGTTGDQVVTFPDAGFPLWVRINLSVAQTVTLHLSAKG